MTNEEVLKVFLKKYRKYTSFKKQKTASEGNIWPVKEAINYNFIWMDTEEGQYPWSDLHTKWVVLCKDFKLLGDLDLNKV